MIELIKDLIRGWRYKRAVKKANELSKLLGIKYLVLYWGGRFKVVPKQNIKQMIKDHHFRKGTKMADIERRALYVTL